MLWAQGNYRKSTTRLDRKDQPRSALHPSRHVHEGSPARKRAPKGAPHLLYAPRIHCLRKTRTGPISGDFWAVAKPPRVFS